jgi:hypothetical protein
MSKLSSPHYDGRGQKRTLSVLCNNSSFNLHTTWTVLLASFLPSRVPDCTKGSWTLVSTSRRVFGKIFQLAALSPTPPTAPLSFLRCYHLNARSSLRQHLRPREKADEGSPARSRGLLRSLQSRTQKEELALIETLESGKPISQARDEIDWITDLWQYGEVLP